MKRLAKAAAIVAASTLLLAACGGASGKPAESSSGKAGGDNIYEGFKKGMADLGYEEGKNIKYEFQNPQGDQATLTSIANTYANADKDLYLAIATPPVQALAQAITDKPIVFSGVTNPEAAGVVKSWEEPGGNVTGMSDLSPVKKQLELLKEIAPDTKSVGIVYASAESNSEVLVDLAKKAGQELGIEIKTATVVNSSEVGQAASSLDVDAYYVPTDNTVVSAIEALVQVAEQKKKPVLAADSASAKRGVVAALSIDYYKQGVQTAAMADKILKGEDPAKMAVQTQDELELVINPKAAERMGVKLPESVVSRADKTV